MARKTTNELIAEVGALIDQTITDSTTPTREQVARWLHRASIKIYKILPPEHLSDVTTEENVYSNTLLGSDLSLPLLRIVDVLANGVTCTKITEAELASLSFFSPYKFTAQQPAYSVKGFGGSTKIRVWPPTTSYITVIYIPTPTEYTVGSTGDSFSVPEALEEYVVMYAANMARIQDEEPGQVQLYEQMWMKDIQTAYSIPAQNADL